MRNQKFMSHTRRIWERFRDDSVIVVVNRADPPISCPRSRCTNVNGERGRRIIPRSSVRGSCVKTNIYSFGLAFYWNAAEWWELRKIDGIPGSRCSTVSKAPSIILPKLYGGKIYDFKIILGGSANRISNVKLSDAILFNNDISACISDVSKIYDLGPPGYPLWHTFVMRGRKWSAIVFTEYAIQSLLRFDT